MIRIIDFETGKDYDLKSGTKISVDKTNPFLSDKGSLSLPLELAPTDKNFELLDFPYRLDRKNKMQTKRSIIIDAGIFQTKATMVITNVTRKTIIVTCLFEESVFYNLMKDIKLETVFENIVRDDFSNLSTLELRIAAWVDHCEKVMIGQVSDVFHVFPVCYEINGNGYDNNSMNGILNMINQSHTAVYDSKKYCKLAANYARIFSIDGANINIPVGYEVSPFLKMSYVLSQIFSNYGYTLNEDYLTKYPDLQKEVVLNNTIDSLMLGNLQYKQLVPSCTINEYLDSIRYKYGCEFFPSENNKMVSIVFWNDLLESVDSNYSNQKSDDVEITYENFKKIKLICDISNKPKELFNTSGSDEVSAPIVFESLQQMIIHFVDKRYLNYAFITENNYDIYKWNVEFIKNFESLSRVQDECEQNNEEYLGSICFVQSELKWYYRYDPHVQPGYAYILIDENVYNFFDEKTDSEDYREIKSTHVAVPMAYINLHTTFDSLSLISNYTNLLLPYINGSRKLNTYTIINGSVQSSTDNECKIMSCFHVGTAKTLQGPFYDTYTISYGSTYRYDDLGDPWGLINMSYGGENGLYETFWKKFDSILRNSFQPIKIPLNLTSSQIFNLAMQKQIYFENQNIIPESLKYEITDQGINVIEAKFRTTKLYV